MNVDAYHIPVLLRESVDGLAVRGDGIYADLTYGGGGHSREILSKLGGSGRLVVFDQDEDALAQVIKDERLVLVHHNFRFLKQFLEYHKLCPVDGVLADLGVSSHQFDTPSRGFSFREDGPLDMRMSQGMELTAADLLQNATPEELMYVFGAYGEIDHPGRLVTGISAYRKSRTFRNVADLLGILESVAPKQAAHKFRAKVFQALRIEVNQELRALEEMLRQLALVVRKGGRISIISYHSLEDRLVKNLILKGNIEGKDLSDAFGRARLPFKAIPPKLIQPSDGEVNMNPRSRSARLRIAERI